MSIQDPFRRALLCAALDPALRSILVFDSSPAALQATANEMAMMLRAVTGHDVNQVILGTAKAEDELWGYLTVRTLAWGPAFVWQLSRLAQASADVGPRLVVIPDLTRISLPAVRACIALMGAEVAALQRHGQAVTWAPDLCWLAGCARDEIGEVSPHLLDRFALRLQMPTPPATDRVADVRASATGNDVPPLSAPVTLSDSLRHSLEQAIQPEVPDAILHYATTYLATKLLPGVRRELAFLRLSRAIARLHRSPVVTQAHVDQAAGILGLTPMPTSPTLKTVPTDPLPPSAPPIPSGSPTDGVALGSSPLTAGPGSVEVVHEPVFEPDTETVFPALADKVTLEPYPEDTAPTVREPNALKLPWQRHGVAMSTRGTIIGTMPARGFEDLALVSTILEAAKYRQLRRDRKHGVGTLMITPADLRRYRRSPTPDQMLVLVLDHTAVSNCDWQQAIIPHLQWAYFTRASVYLVQVGSALAVNPLCAEQIAARSMLDPRLGAAFDAPSGTATPLAHGLHLAMRALQAAIRHGRSRVQCARIVVLSDGRGNVPLDASLIGELLRPVTHEGIDDALQLAGNLGALNNVEAFFLNPGPRHHPDLPLAFAELLRARMEPVPSLDVAVGLP